MITVVWIALCVVGIWMNRRFMVRVMLDLDYLEASGQNGRLLVVAQSHIRQAQYRGAIQWALLLLGIAALVRDHWELPFGGILITVLFVVELALVVKELDYILSRNRLDAINGE